MARTDGYLTLDTGDGWLYSNVGGAQGDITTPAEQGVYARFEHPMAPIPGTRVDGKGVISSGASISLTDPDAILSAVPEEPSDRPYILWAGVSPMSLNEALIVWNTSIVLLNKAKITGGSVAAVTGRLMVLKLDSPVAITGLEQRQINIQPGAVGFYRSQSDAQTIAEQIEEAQEEDEPFDEEFVEEDGAGGFCFTDRAALTAALGTGSLGGDPSSPSGDCPCSDIIYESSGGGGGAGAGAEVLSSLFSTMCNPSAQCGEFAGNTTQFVVNNSLKFPVRCVHPFYLARLVTGGGCTCVNCFRYAYVWEAAMDIFGGTLPGDVFPLDQLMEYDACGVGDNFPQGYPCVISVDIECEVPCAIGSAEILGRFGPPVVVGGYWRNSTPGYKGQPALYQLPCNTICGDPCSAELLPEQADYYAVEDIIKPTERMLEVKHFGPWTLNTQTVDIPTAVIPETITIIDSYETIDFSAVTAVVVDTISGVFEPDDGAWISEINFDDKVLPTLVTVNTITYVEPVSVFSSIAVGTIGAVSEFGAATITHIDYNDFFVIDNLSEREIVYGEAGAEQVIQAITAGVEAVGVEEGPVNLVTSVLLTAVTELDIPEYAYSAVTGDVTVITNSSNNVINGLVTGGAVVISFDVIPIEACVDGTATSIDVVANLVTGAAPTTNITVPFIEVGAQSAVTEVLFQPPVATPVNVAYDVDEGPVNLVTGVTPTAATPVSYTVTGVTAATATVQDVTVIVPTLATAFPVGFLFTEQVEVVTDILLSDAPTATAEIQEFGDTLISIPVITTEAVIPWTITEYDFPEVSANVIANLTVGTDVINIPDPDSVQSFTVIVEADSGNVVPTQADIENCGNRWRLLHHESPLTWTSASLNEAECCVSSAELDLAILPHPSEVNCTSILLAAPKYVSQPAGPTRDLCPCYSQEGGELRESDSNSFEGPPIGEGPNPCTIRVRRLNRRWCVQNNCNS